MLSLESPAVIQIAKVDKILSHQLSASGDIMCVKKHARRESRPKIASECG